MEATCKEIVLATPEIVWWLLNFSLDAPKLKLISSYKLKTLGGQDKTWFIFSTIRIVRFCYFACKADLKARHYMHEFSRYYRCAMFFGGHSSTPSFLDKVFLFSNFG